MRREIPETQFDGVSSYDEKLQYALDSPLQIGLEFGRYDDVAKIIRSDESGQISVAHSEPTPLDPTNVFGIIPQEFSAMSSGHDGHYWRFTEIEALGRVEAMAEKYGLDDDLHQMIAAEVAGQTHIRCERNQASYDRLKLALRDRPASDGLLEVVMKARTGSANLAELAQLIKEYPEMISVEAFKITKPLASKDLNIARLVLDEKIADLQHTFNDAEVTLLDTEQRRNQSTVGFEANTYIVKEKLADIRSTDSHTEVIRKRTGFLMPDNFSIHGQRLPSVELPCPDGKILKYKSIPLSYSYYLRTADYKERQAREAEKMAARLSAAAEEVGDMAFDDDFARQISDPEMRKSYIEGRLGKLGTNASQNLI